MGRKLLVVIALIGGAGAVGGWLADDTTKGANASLHPLIGDRVFVDVGFMGCKDQGDEDKLKEFIRVKDAGTFGEYAHDHSSSCHGFLKGDSASVDDTSVWHSTACIRPAGRAYCYWMPISMLRK